MSQPTHTHKYIPRIPEREENLFLEEYYSGTDTKVYIDNEEQTEIAYISYSVSEQLKPLYGYASRTWDDVAVGTRIVTGAFKVSVKNPEEQSTYEEVVLHQVIDKEQSTLEEIANKNEEEEKAKENEEWIDDGSDETSGDEETTEDEGSNDDNITPQEPKETFSQEVQDYQIKLKTLGYTIIVADGLVDEDGEVMGLTIAAILEFCSDHGVIPARKFTTDIKNAIDKALTTDTLVEHKLNTTAIFRHGPGDEYGVVATVPSGTIVYVIGQQDVYVKLQTQDGIVGYTRSIFIM
jgi:hypothetical protein